MMRVFLALLLFIVTVTSSAREVSFDLAGQSFGAVAHVVYLEALKDRSFALAPEVVEDRRPVAFRYSVRHGDFRAFWLRFVRSLGYAVDDSGSVDLISPAPKTDEHRSGLNNPDNEAFYYAPRHRDAVYLVDMLSPLFQGRFSVARIAQHQQGAGQFAQQQPQSQQLAPVRSVSVSQQSSSIAHQQADQLLFIGSRREVVELKKLLAQVDETAGQVLVTGVLYEVSTKHAEGSALQLAGSLLSGRLEFSAGGSSRADNFFSLKLGDLSAVIRALDTDDRFKVVASPQVRVSSGNTASFVVGEDVPVLGAVSYQQGSGVPVQSVDYRSSGVIFNISPKVRAESIDVRIDQQVSAFQTTTTGVNNSPTLSKRALSTSVSFDDGGVVVIGGLKQEKQGAGISGLSFFPDWLKAKTADKSSSEMLLFLQVRRL